MNARRATAPIFVRTQAVEIGGEVGSQSQDSIDDGTGKDIEFVFLDDIQA